jgi:histidine triad (HIT) family protein
MATCLFCSIVSGESPADVVHSTDSVLAFRDARPVAPTHVLIIPKEHVSSAADLRAEHASMLTDVFNTASHLAATEGLDDGWRVVTNVGPHAGQSVLHLHFHLLGGRHLGWPPG